MDISTELVSQRPSVKKLLVILIDYGSEIATFMKWKFGGRESTKYMVVNSYFINKLKRRANIAPRKQQERRQSSQIVAGKKLNKIENQRMCSKKTAGNLSIT